MWIHAGHRRRQRQHVDQAVDEAEAAACQQQRQCGLLPDNARQRALQQVRRGRDHQPRRGKIVHVGQGDKLVRRGAGGVEFAQAAAELPVQLLTLALR